MAYVFRSSLPPEVCCIIERWADKSLHIDRFTPTLKNVRVFRLDNLVIRCVCGRCDPRFDRYLKVKHRLHFLMTRSENVSRCIDLFQKQVLMTEMVYYLMNIRREPSDNELLKSIVKSLPNPDRVIKHVDVLHKLVNKEGRQLAIKLFPEEPEPLGWRKHRSKFIVSLFDIGDGVIKSANCEFDPRIYSLLRICRKDHQYFDREMKTIVRNTTIQFLFRHININEVVEILGWSIESARIFLKWRKFTPKPILESKPSDLIEDLWFEVHS